MTDADDVYRNWVTDPEVSRFWGWEPHTCIEQTKQCITSWVEEYAKLDTYHWTIELKSIREPIGYIYLNAIDEADDSISVHFALGRKHWNKGIMPEACKGVIDFAFSALGVKRIHTLHHIDNPASGRVMQKCGMRHVKTAYKDFPDCDQLNGDYCYYEITTEDWERVT